MFRQTISIAKFFKAVAKYLVIPRCNNTTVNNATHFGI